MRRGPGQGRLTRRQATLHAVLPSTTASWRCTGQAMLTRPGPLMSRPTTMVSPLTVARMGNLSFMRLVSYCASPGIILHCCNMHMSYNSVFLQRLFSGAIDLKIIIFQPPQSSILIVWVADKPQYPHFPIISVRIKSLLFAGAVGNGVRVNVPQSSFSSPAAQGAQIRLDFPAIWRQALKDIHHQA